MARRKRYSPELKRQALRRANEPCVIDALVCEQLGVSTRQLRRWREALQEHGEENAFPGQACSNCALYQGKAGDEWAGCLIFPGKAVKGTDCCSVYAPKPS